MYLIKLEQGTDSRVIAECQTLIEAKPIIDDQIAGKKECDEETDGAFRIVTYDILEDGNLEMVDCTPFFAD